MKVSMERITNDNCQGLCIQEYCSAPYTYYTKIILNGMRLVIGLCKKHAEEFETNGWRD